MGLYEVLTNSQSLYFSRRGRCSVLPPWGETVQSRATIWPLLCCRWEWMPHRILPSIGRREQTINADLDTRCVETNVFGRVLQCRKKASCCFTCSRLPNTETPTFDKYFIQPHLKKKYQNVPLKGALMSQLVVARENKPNLSDKLCRCEQKPDPETNLSASHWHSFGDVCWFEF